MTLKWTPEELAKAQNPDLVNGGIAPAGTTGLENDVRGLSGGQRKGRRSKVITTAKELYRIGIEETEKERAARGVPLETEWVREHAGLPSKK